jgi:small GTP-binding protein
MNIQSSFDYFLKIIIIGDTGVGKSNFLYRFVNGKFSQLYQPTIGMDYKSKIVVLPKTKQNVNLQFWDTAGQERYKSLTQGYFRNAEGIMIVYDVSNLVSFENLKYWIQSIKTHIDIDKGEVPAIIIGNKIDIFEREVKKEDAEAFAKEEGFKYFETSAKSGKGVNECIKYLVKTILRNWNDKEEEKEKQFIKIDKGNENKDDDNKFAKKMDKCCGKD